MNHCIYDNPVTFRREFWRNRVCKASFSASFIKHKPNLIAIKRDGFHEDWCKEWRTGQLSGNPHALPMEVDKYVVINNTKPCKP